MPDLTERIRSEAEIAARPGQYDRLMAIAAEVDALEAAQNGCYICQPGNPNAADEGCSDCDSEFFEYVDHVAAALEAANPTPANPQRDTARETDQPEETV